MKLVKDGDQLMRITDRGQTLRTTVDEIRETGRNAQGVRIMNVGEDERIVALERIAEALPAAARAAAAIQQELGVEARLVEGGRAEYTVWVGDERVVRKRGLFVWPTDRRIVDAVRAALKS